MSCFVMVRVEAQAVGAASRGRSSGHLRLLPFDGFRRPLLQGGDPVSRVTRAGRRASAPARFARLIARVRPHARGSRRTHPSRLLPWGLFSRRRDPKRPPDNRFLPPHLMGGGADFNPCSGIFSKIVNLTCSPYPLTGRAVRRTELPAAPPKEPTGPGR